MGVSDREDGVRLVAASSLTPAELTEVFNLGFAGYLVPMQMNEDALREHIAVNDIDLDRSLVALDGQPAGLVLTGLRGADAWIGGMGVAPGHRRTGLGARLLTAALDGAAAAGATTMWLEVIEANHAAIRLYERLGFTRRRHLTVWTLAPADRGTPEHHALDLDHARDWIAAHRAGREPWQRADASLTRMRERGATLGAVAVQGSDGMAGAAVYKTDGATVTIIQLAALHRAAAADLIAAVAGSCALRLSNVPTDHLFSDVLRELGGEAVVAQHEMSRDLSAAPPAESPPDGSAAPR
jgi:ribosomal protein S18 acetylase RimI-like enzyme